MKMRSTRIGVLALAAVTPSMAQTRVSEIDAARDQKTLQLRPDAVSSLENELLRVKERKLMERVTYGFHGLRIQPGNVAFGSGFAAGPQFFRDDPANGRMRVHASAMISTRFWHKYEAGTTAPRLAGGLLTLGVEATRRDCRSLDYYCSGPDSKQPGRSAYRQQDTFVGGVAVVGAIRRFRAGGSVGGLWVDPGTSNREELARTETLFNDAPAAGLAAETHFLRSSIFGRFDYRDNSAGPKAGGSYLSEYFWYKEKALGTFSFHRWDIDVQQYVPFFNKTPRLALRARMSLTDLDGGSRVPFYLQPRLGGSDDWRGFRPYRFTDRNAIVYNAEYRWETFSGLDRARSTIPNWLRCRQSNAATLFDNEREISEEMPAEGSARLPVMRGDGYWMALLESPERPRQSVRVYINKRGEFAQIVGVDRTW
jgi:hypothetical protein